jgi:hypothetical protein
MTKFKIPLIFQCLTLLVPLNIYVIGDWLGSGEQWALFRYQQSYRGNSLIPFTSEINYVLSGVIFGRSALSLLIWGLGACLLIAAFIILLFAYQEQSEKKVKITGIITMAAGFFFIISCIIQYGIFLNGSAGFAIPVGIPFLFITGWLMYSSFYRGITPEDDIDTEETDE